LTFNQRSTKQSVLRVSETTFNLFSALRKLKIWHSEFDDMSTVFHRFAHQLEHLYLLDCSISHSSASFMDHPLYSTANQRGCINGLLTSLTSRLRTLYVRNCPSFSWDLSLVSQLQGLQVIHIADDQSNNELFGDISFVKTLTNLRKLSFFGVELKGSLDDGNFQLLHHLRELHMESENIEGDLSGLKTLTKLTDLTLRCPEVVGDICLLSHFTNLKSLTLNGMTKLTGDIIVFSNLASNIQECHLWDLKSISGDILSFSNLTRLTSIVLKCCENLHGNISSFSNLTNLEDLRVTGSTGIHGNINSLADVYENIAQFADEDYDVNFDFDGTSVENDDFA
jgi:hypothetical protein